MVSPVEMKLVKESLPRFERRGYDIAVGLYREVFKVDKSLRNLFSLEFLAPKKPANDAPSRCPFAGEDSLELPLSMQARILAQTIVTMASNIDNLSSVDSAIERICNKHVSRDIRAEHYGVVAAAFDSAMRTVLKDELSADEFAAWGSAIGALANVFIARETSIREAAAAKDGGWVGFRKFTVERQVEMGSAGAKLVLVPVDKGIVSRAGKGQFSCLRMNVDNFGTIYHNTFLKKEANPEETASSDLQTENKHQGVGPNRLAALSVTTPQRRGSSSRLASTGSNSEISPESKGDPAYGTVISTAAARPQPFANDPKLSEVFVTPGRVISQHATEGAVVELSVPVGGYSNPGMNDTKAGKLEGKSLLRNTLDKSGSKFSGNPLLRQIALSESPGLKSPRSGKSPMTSVSAKTKKSTVVDMAMTKKTTLSKTSQEGKFRQADNAPFAAKCPMKTMTAVKGERFDATECRGSKGSDPQSTVHSSSSKIVLDSCPANEKSGTIEKTASLKVESELSPTNVVPGETL